METREELRERLAVEGKKFSGHVTNGSLDAQMVVVEEAIAQALAEDRSELNRHSSGGM